MLSILFRVAFSGFVGKLFFSRHLFGLNVVGDVVASTLIGPIFPIALTLFYYDQRIRQEGYDIERMMDAAGMNAPEASLAGDSTVVSAAEGIQP